ncbi:MAG: hypothetical protein ACI31G_02025 [Bacilli bacterium]
MKIKKIIPLFIFPFLLTSCGSSSMTLLEAKEYCSNFSHPQTVESRYNNVLITYNSEIVLSKTNVNGSYYTEGSDRNTNIWGLTSEEDFLNDTSLKYRPLRTRFLRFVPLFINSTFFDEGGSYYSLSESIFNAKQSYGSITIKENDLNGVTLSVSKVSGYYTFYQTAYDDYEGTFEDINVFGRFNMEFVYNSEGFLVLEKVISSNYSTNNDAYIKLESEYEYSN